jgi:hypothetical protein
MPESRDQPDAEPDRGRTTSPEGDVLSALPRSRPQRRSARRAPTGGGEATESASSRRGRQGPPPARTDPKRQGDPAAGPGTAGPGTPPAPGEAAGAGEAVALESAGSTRPPAAPGGASPSAETPGGRAGEAPERGVHHSRLDLVTTVVRAAGELAQIGVTFGVHVARRALSRLSRS